MDVLMFGVSQQPTSAGIIGWIIPVFCAVVGFACIAIDIKRNGFWR